MILKGIIDEDFVNYKLPCMTLMFPYCNFKCEINGTNYCHNSALIKEPDIEVSAKDIYKRYSSNPISEAICCQGMEPFDSWDDLYDFIVALRIHYSCFDDIVIYTGYDKEEIQDKVEELQLFSNIIIKYGRYIPNQKPHYDEILGVNLASDNQYAEKL